MTREIIDTIAKYVIALVVVGSCFYIIASATAGIDTTQAWTLLGLIVGWLIRDSAGNTASANTAKVAAASAPVVITGEQANA